MRDAGADAGWIEGRREREALVAVETTELETDYFDLACEESRAKASL